MNEWAWSVEGREVPTGTMERSFTDTGTVGAEGAGAAIAEVLNHGPFWDVIDQDQQVSVTVWRKGS